jgi:hypothetical protein
MHQDLRAIGETCKAAAAALSSTELRKEVVSDELLLIGQSESAKNIFI